MFFLSSGLELASALAAASAPDVPPAPDTAVDDVVAVAAVVEGEGSAAGKLAADTVLGTAPKLFSFLFCVLAVLRSWNLSITIQYGYRNLKLHIF